MNVAALLQRYAKAGWQHRWKSLAVAWLVCLLGWTGVVLMPNSYESYTRIYADADAILGQLLRGIAIDQTPAGQVEIMQRTLLSRPNVERVIARTDLDLRVRTTADRERLIEELGKDIKISPVPQARNLFTITYRDRDARTARAVVQTLVELFMESATVNDRQQMENARSFITQQINAYEVQLRDAERRRAEFRARHLDVLPATGATGVPRLEASRQKLLELQGALQDSRLRRDLMQRQLEQTPQTLTTGAGGIAGPGGPTRLAEAERNLRELRLRYTENHPDVVSARRQIEELRTSGAGSAPAAGGPAVPTGRAAAAIPGLLNPVYEQIKLRIVDLEAQMASQERQIRDEEAEIQRLEAAGRNAIQLQAEALNLDRDYEVLRKNYEELLERREAVQIAGAARVGAERIRLEVVDPPVVPQIPAGPNRLLFAAGVLVLGIGAGLGLAFLLVTLDTSFYTMQDLRAIGLPVLGGISAATAPPRNVMGGVAFGGAAAMLLVGCVLVVMAGSGIATRLPQLLAGLRS